MPYPGIIAHEIALVQMALQFLGVETGMSIVQELIWFNRDMTDGHSVFPCSNDEQKSSTSTHAEFMECTVRWRRKRGVGSNPCAEYLIKQPCQVCFYESGVMPGAPLSRCDQEACLLP